MRRTSSVIKEGVGTAQPDTKAAQEAANFRVNPVMALIPVVPLFLLVIASKQVGWLPTKAFSVPDCMLIGTAPGLVVGLVHKQDPGEVSKKFCAGGPETASTTW